MKKKSDERKIHIAKTLTGGSIRNALSLVTRSNGLIFRGSRGMFLSFRFALTEFNIIYTPLGRPCQVENQPRWNACYKVGKFHYEGPGPYETFHDVFYKVTMVCQRLITPRFACGHFHSG